jgi:hypothetical protein
MRHPFPWARRGKDSLYPSAHRWAESPAIPNRLSAIVELEQRIDQLFLCSDCCLNQRCLNLRILGGSIQDPTDR